MSTIKPPRLYKKDKIGIISPSGDIADRREIFERAGANFGRIHGLEIVWGENAFAEHYYSAGTAKQRLDDFHNMLSDNSIKAIVFSVGGNTGIDLLENLDFDLIMENPKIISGISDATTLLHAISAKTGLVTFLGLELKYYADQQLPYQDESIQKAWLGDYKGVLKPNDNWRELEGFFTTYNGWRNIRGGRASGILVGGNSSSFLQLVDTDYQLPFAGNILFFEAYKLPKKKIHKAIVQLKLRGLLEGLGGMVVGYCVGSDDKDDLGNERDIGDMLLEILGEYEFPIMQVGEIGHQVENFLQPIGARVSIDASNLRFSIDEDVAV